MIQFAFPSDPVNQRLFDDSFIEQIEALKDKDFNILAVHDDMTCARVSGVRNGDQIVYRGWMLDSEKYSQLVRSIDLTGAIAFTSLHEYLQCHHMLHWYDLISKLTPETKFFVPDDHLVDHLKELNWPAYFIKDYVKSLKAESFIKDPEQALSVLAKLKEYRGQIEGGVCVRRVENFLPETERRYFVVKDKAYGPDSSHIPDIVQQCVQKIDSPFYSVDIAQLFDGKFRIIELGDGQVSDLVDSWTPPAFAEMWADVRRRGIE